MTKSLLTMEDAIKLFKKVYVRTQSIEVCIAELKRHGFSQNDTVNVMVLVIKVNVVDADEWVSKSLAWEN